MAQKRMFDKVITNSDDFLEMPDSSQNLYFHLSMNADDDGFVNNWKTVIKITGTKEDDLRILISKQFVIPFESGVIVIRHWRINNYLRSDRYTPTIFTKEKEQLEIKGQGAYQLKDEHFGIPTVYPVKNRIDKNRIDKNSIEENIYICADLQQNDNTFDSEFEQLWNIYPKKRGKKNAKKSFIKARKSKIAFEIIENGLKNYLKYIKLEKVEDKYIKDGSTWFNQECWNDDYTIKRKLTTNDLDIDISDF